MFSHGASELAEKITRDSSTLGNLITRHLAEFDRTVKTYGGELVERLGQRTTEVSTAMHEYVEGFDSKVGLKSTEVTASLDQRLQRFQEALDSRTQTLNDALSSRVMPLPLSLSVQTEAWPIAGTFAISRGAKTEAQVVVVTLSDGRHRGRGECVPYGRYDETVAGVVAALQALIEPLGRGLDRIGLQSALPAGAARNALDCAFWDLEAKRAGVPVHQLAGVPAPRALTTAYTISLGTPAAMAEAAGQSAGRALLKIKLGTDDDPERIAAVRAAAPHSELIVDANEGWNTDNLVANLAACAAAGVTMLNQKNRSG